MSSTALQKFEQPQTLAPSTSEFQVMKETASMLTKTGFLPQSIKTPEQAVAIILTGRELGIGTMAALNNINVIQGKPTVSPQLMLALIERSGQLEDIKVEPHLSGVKCTMKRKGRSPHTETFGDPEAQAMGLASKDNYKKQKLTMYRWRAIAACARVVFPDVITGLYTPDEMGADVNEDGEIQQPARPNVVDMKYGEPDKVSPAVIDADMREVEAIEAELIDIDESFAREEITNLCKAFNASPNAVFKGVADEKYTWADAVRRTRLRAIDKTFTANDWNEDSVEAYLNGLKLSGPVDSLSDDDLCIIVENLREAKML